ncbi:beta-glucosidase [Jatrophihabitans sp. GAS493]|uniref:beta-glucosidase n=1 Tax=Jatrophihabitans sp. GAS493 TaxID=1907575 RepID=UPI000BC01A7A|nr:glycoside hydrolase family 3 C-terminal domain-containing protein [Jatrophihabitans sp. GAS493]SOD74577.1 beta-glucosidase [Jatrophihabitans sp. GAS493]
MRRRRLYSLVAATVASTTFVTTAFAATVTTAGAATPGPLAPSVTARPWLATDLTPAQRANLLIKQMTLPEKVDLMTGNQGDAPYAYYNAPIVRLGIPALKMADASSGVAPRGWSLLDTGQNATSLPSMQALASTWSTTTATNYAKVVAAEVLEAGQNVLLGPDADIIRQPFWGRADETESEDPTLNANITGAYVNAVQSQNVIADLKHYLGYNQETNRGSGQNDVVSQRALREVYALAFESVVKTADPGSVMCSFNKINGEYSCDNALTLRNLLKGQLKFTGFVLTDFGALHDTLKGLQGGTDMETGTLTVYDGALLAAVSNGTASEAQVDQSVLRILTTMFRLGVFDRSYTPSAIPVAAHDAVARKTEESAITLLKNSGGALPLSPATKSIAVIGADANILAAPSGAPWVSPTQETPVLNGILAHAGNASVNWVAGNDPVNAASMLEASSMTTVPSSVLTPTNGIGTGLQAYYWDNTSFQGSPATSRVEQQVNYDVGFLTTFGLWAGQTSQVPEPPVTSPTDQQSVVYDGKITAPKTGDYVLDLTGFGQATLSLDGNQIINMTGADGRKSNAASPVLSLAAGVPHTLHITYQATHPFDSLEPGTLLLQWKTPASTYSPAIKAAAAAAKKAQVAIVYVRTYEGEQRDRVSLKLPQSSNELIAAVRAANPNTIVVLANSGPVTMPWLSSVPAVVETYFGGQEQGAALANVLWGDVNPSGKLTVTYPTSDTAIPPGVTNPWATATNLNVTYGEGINVGYKAYDVAGIKPLFPFGFGLSYTTFGYANLRVTPAVVTAKTPVNVKFQVTNTGVVSGAEVAEVYVGLPSSTGEPPKRLVGYAKRTIAAGGVSAITVTIDPAGPTNPLSYFNTTNDKWQIAAGTYTLYVGSSERNTPLSTTFNIATAV